MKRSLALLLAVLAMLLVACTAKTPEPTPTFEFPMPEITQNPIATLTFTTGDVVKIELYPDKAPQTVSSFIYLANTENYYDGLIFHRIEKNLIMQGGSSSGDGKYGAGYNITGEFSANGWEENDLKHVPGTISMARIGGDNNSADAQFFLCVAAHPAWDGQYAAFGTIMENLEAIEAFCAQPLIGGAKPMRPPKLESIRVETFGVTYPEPHKLPGDPLPSPAA